MKKIALWFFILLFSSNFTFSQKAKVEFTYFKNVPSGKVVYFQISGALDDDRKEQILETLKNDPNVKYCRFTKDNWIQAEINNSIDAGYVRNLLLFHGADFEFSSGGVSYTKINEDEKKEQVDNSAREEERAAGNPQEVTPGAKRTDGMPEHYPVFINTGNPDYDNRVYEQKKQEWIANYPLEVEQATGRPYSEVTNNSVKNTKENPPVLVDTGNPAEDSKRHEEAMKKWIEQNSSSK